MRRRLQRKVRFLTPILTPLADLSLGQAVISTPVPLVTPSLASQPLPVTMTMASPVHQLTLGSPTSLLKYE